MNLLGKSFPTRFTAVFMLLAAVAYIPVLVGLPFNGVYTPLERNWHDASFVLRGQSLPSGDPRLVLISVDDETVHKHGFPLPRKAYAQALDKLKELGAKTVAFDVLFLEPREGDAELAAATRRHGGVVHLYTAEPPSKEGEGEGERTQMTIAPLRSTAKLLGSPVIAEHVDLDGHVRSFSLFNTELQDPVRKGRPVTSLAAAVIAVDGGKTLDEVEAENPADPNVPFVINYRRPTDHPTHEVGAAGKSYYSPYRWISLMDLLAGRLSDAQRKALKGSIALVASTTTGYFDHYPTPFTPQAPGGEYHLNILDNVLRRDPLQATSRVWVLLLVLACAWLPWLFHRRLSPAWAALGSAGAVAALVGGSLWLMSRGYVLYPVAPALTLIVGFLVLTVHRVLTEGAEKKLIKGMFGQFVSPEVVEELANNPEKAKLGAQKRDMTVFFLDIAHFTTISEKMGPEALMAFLNKYLSALSHEVLERKGTIDKYIGDCIMAFWNAPLENKDHRRDAALSALACQRVIDELNKSLDPGLPEIPAIRIGINSGEMNVGFTGTERKLQYTVIGDEVNLASRLEGANKFFGSKIILSGSTYENGAKDVVEARYLGRARVVGKETPVPVYEPLAEKGKLDGAWAKALPLWEKGVKTFYDKKYDEALPLFEELAKLLPDDGPTDLYLKMARDYSVLPPDDWDQVFNLTAK